MRRWHRAGMVAAVLAAGAHSQVYRSESTVLSGTIKPALRSVLAAVSEQPGTLVLLVDTEAGILTSARLLTGVELEQTALQQAPALAALSVNSVFVRASEHSGSEVYGHSSLLVMGPGDGHPQFLNSTGRPEAQLMAALSVSSRQAAGRVRDLPMAAGAVWDVLRRLEAQGAIESRVSSPELGVTTIVRWGQRAVTIGTLFVEETSAAEVRIRSNAIVLSTPDCLPVPRGKAAPESALLELIAGGGITQTVARSALGSTRFCALLTEPAEFVPLYRIRSEAARTSIAADAESVWSALLLVARQFAVVTAVDKARRRIQYEAPCWQRPPPEPREKRFERLIRPGPGCTASVWLEPRPSATDVFAAFAPMDPLGRNQLEMLLDKVVTQVFAEEGLHFLTQESTP